MSLLSVVIPVFNEKATILEIVRRVREAPVPGVRKEVILVDDFSTDGTREIVRENVERQEGVKVFYHDANRGKGAALRTGFAQSTGDIVIVQDADFEYDPREYSKVIGPILEGKADVVYGSRFSGGDSRQVHSFWHSMGNKALTTFSNMVTDLYLTDMETCYKAFRGEVIRGIPIEEDRFGFEPEITAKVARLRCRVHEVGISYSGRTYADGKKIGWKDGVRAIWCILKYR